MWPRSLTPTRDTLGTRGMAYDVDLYDYKVVRQISEGRLPGLSSNTNITRVFSQLVTDNICVANNSRGSGKKVTNY